MPNYFTINGKAYPATETVHLQIGEKVRVRFIGTSSGFIHPMHIHGGPFEVIAIDGYPVPDGARVLQDTVNIGPGQRYDVIWEAREPGKWLLHCHVNHHTTNNNVEVDGAGGLTLIIDVAAATAGEIAARRYEDGGVEGVATGGWRKMEAARVRRSPMRSRVR